MVSKPSWLMPAKPEADGHPGDHNVADSPTASSLEKDHLEDGHVPFLTWRTFLMAVLVSMGGLVFGYDTGQISGFLQMDDFLKRFADKQNPPAFSNVRSGLIVGMLSIGTMIGALVSAPIANTPAVGRKLSIAFWCVIFAIGVVIQIASDTPRWYEVMIGRIIAGLGIGALSVLVPMYQGESAPTRVRGAIVCCYQLFITLGILIAYLINFGTEKIHNTAAWRIPMGIGFLWAIVLGFGILLFPESPRFDYRNGKVQKARATMAKLHGVSENHRVIHRQLRELEEKLEAERQGGDHPWYEIFTGPRMMYRTILGMFIQAFQQLTGANYFFYYGTTIFASVGLSNSFVTQIILGAVNVGMTFPGLYFVERYGRRKCLVSGALWMFTCFIIFASLGQFKLTNDDGSSNKSVGYGMIVLACLFIAAFASTWGPMAWACVAEIYPGRYRSECISLCSASNWIFNFLLAFFTPFITGSINFAYGYVFAGCNLAAAITVYFFLPETQGKSLEEIDTMFLLEVKPWKSSKWQPPEGENLITADKLMLDRGARNFSKVTSSTPGAQQMERPGEKDMPEVPIMNSNDLRSVMGTGTRGESFVTAQE